MKYSEKELSALISEVEAEFSKHLEKAETTDTKEQKLEKSEPTTETVDSEEKQEENVVKSEDNKQPEYSEDDVEEMYGLYASMSKSEKEAHYQSVKKALFGDEAEKEQEKTEKSEMTKSEDESSDLMKSELEEAKTQLEKKEKENEDLKKSFSELIKKLNGFVKKSAPKQKAITRIEYVAKSEDADVEKKEQKEDISKLEKSEIANRLNTKIQSGELKKSDRDLINAYYLDGKGIETIKHLL